MCKSRSLGRAFKALLVRAENSRVASFYMCFGDRFYGTSNIQGELASDLTRRALGIVMSP